MKSWYTKISVFVVAGLAYLVGQYFRGYWWPRFTWPFPCREITFGSSTYCDPIYINTLGFPLLVLGEFLVGVGLALLFANERGIRAWIKFSLWYVPIATAIVLWVYPVHFGFFFSSTTVWYDVGVNRAGWIYIAVTLGIVIWTRFVKSKSQGRKI